MTKLINSKIDKILSEKYLSYAVSTIVSRSLPDVRDGLKPVHRRIIYSMYQLNLFNNSSFKKSARIVGDVMGKFHPHGDQAIYQSLVRLAQDFSTRVTLIEGQGNFGNVDGDNAAAMRYTEARLEKIANYFFDGIEEDSVIFKENYDGQNLEPEVLPTKLPNLLLNGSSGIAVGMATNIPPHNLKELNDCLITLLKKPDFTNTRLINILTGPDLPTGGEIILTTDDKKNIYTKGIGSFIINSKWHSEKLKNGMYQIIISEIPYQVNKTKIIEQLANLINIKKIPLDDVIDESDHNIRIVLRPKNRNIDSFKLMNLCFKLTELSIKFSCNFNVLEDGIIPKQLGLKEILEQFIKYRKLTIRRKSKFNINKIKLRLEILEGFLIVYKFLDKIIKIIRKHDDPKKEMIKKFKLNLNQAEAIMSMRLGSLKKLDEQNTILEIKNLKQELNFLNKLIKNSKILDNYIIKEIEEINNSIPDNIKLRRTKVLSKSNLNTEVKIDEFDEIEKLTIIINKDSTIKRLKDYLDIDQIRKDDNKIKYATHILSNEKLLIFLSSGRVFSLDPNILPGGKSNPKSFIQFIEAGTNDKIVGVLNGNQNTKCLFVTKFGKGFIAPTQNMITNQRKGKQIFNLKSNDNVVRILNYNKTHLVCVTKLGKMLIFDTNILPIMNKGVGVQLIKLKENDNLSDVKLINLSEGLQWLIGSKKRRIEDVSFWNGKRAQAGKKIPKYFNKSMKFDS
ncbi:MAG: DNA topoisomerase 4 subunit A [Alphaproteobacteria bacterium MarineAlpha5_Bin5]|nr:MAG: DNA topoisomerase 4 subunit A [Alphaproteobacteria bacterium MarineAlpha5_Bin5]PPR52324.1 MAG: DNA topoisomerase 4 subunit A [Alphaproteobacteria bacterium MarineAlpha5_Bin4]|tara:strand:- start:523 stop:2721 length:2199 start_codon:yes stop_codon:yes gene_type:complete